MKVQEGSNKFKKVQEGTRLCKMAHEGSMKGKKVSRRYKKLLKWFKKVKKEASRKFNSFYEEQRRLYGIKWDSLSLDRARK